MLTDKRVLVTGGTGSLGQVLVRRLLDGERGAPGRGRRVLARRGQAARRCGSRSCTAGPRPTTSSTTRNATAGCSFRIGDVRDYEAGRRACLEGADIVFHAAALKQVPDLRVLPRSRRSRRTSAGPRTSSGRSREHGARGRDGGRRLHRQGVQAGQRDGHDQGDAGADPDRGQPRCPDTRFVCVRYGNVLASRGSVVPLFHEQIASGGPVTITTPEMTRFLLSLDEAVDTVFAALRTGAAGETYVPRCPPRASSTSPRR